MIAQSVVPAWVVGASAAENHLKHQWGERSVERWENREPSASIPSHFETPLELVFF